MSCHSCDKVTEYCDLPFTCRLSLLLAFMKQPAMFQGVECSCPHCKKLRMQKQSGWGSTPKEGGKGSNGAKFELGYNLSKCQANPMGSSKFGWPLRIVWVGVRWCFNWSLDMGYSRKRMWPWARRLSSAEAILKRLDSWEHSALCSSSGNEFFIFAVTTGQPPP